MRGSWPVVGLVALLVACAPVSRSPLEGRVLLATRAAWAEAGLPAPRPGCRLEAFRIELPHTLDAFKRACSGQGRPPEQVRAWACLRWRYEAPRVRTILYPAAVLSPELREERRAAGAVHELLHAHASCALGDEDANHVNARVWEGSADKPRPDSAETRAESALYP